MSSTTVKSNKRYTLSDFTYIQSGSALKQTENNPFTEVYWDKFTENRSDSWEWRDTQWLFGPRMTLDIYFYENKSEIYNRDWIALGDEIQINVTIPKAILEKNRTLKSVEVAFEQYGYNYSARISLVYDVEYGFQYFSEYLNFTSGEVDYETIRFSLNTTLSSFLVSDLFYRVSFVGHFTEDAIIGIYEVHYRAVDNYWDEYWPSEGYEMEYRVFELAVGAPYSELLRVKYGDFFTLHTLNMDNETIYTVSSDQKFQFLVNVTTGDLDNVTLFIDIPGDYYIKVTRYGWHREIVETKGGWVYNESRGEYVWDPNATIRVPKDVFGPYEYYEWIWRCFEVNVTWYDWENDTYYNSTYCAPARLALVFDKNANEFKTYIAVEYDTYVESDGGPLYKHVIEYHNLTNLGPEWQVYELLLNESSYWSENGNFFVKFVGFFKPEIGKGSLDIRPMVFLSDGEPIYMFYPEDCYDCPYGARIAVNQPYVEVIVPKSLFGTIFLNKNETFNLITRMTGDESFINDVDGIRIYLNAYSSYWSENVTIESSVDIIITVDITRNLTKIETFNATYKNVYEDGTWRPYFYNQSSGEWVEGYYTWHGKETRVSNYIDLKNYTVYFEKGFKVIDVNLSFTKYAAESSYYIWVDLVNITYGEDTSMPFGEYEVYDWREEVVYSFIMDGEKKYVDVRKEWIAVGDTNPSENLVIRKPYIMLGSQKYYIKYKEYFDPYSSSVYKDLLFEEFDNERGENRYYFKLLNGTKIYVYEEKIIKLFEVEIYTDTGSLRVNVTTEWPIWLGLREIGGPDYIWFLENGSFLLFDVPPYFEYTGYNVTIGVENKGFFVYVYNTSEVLKLEGDIKYDPYTGRPYLELENGTILEIYYYDYFFYYLKDGARYYITGPIKFINATYDGKEIIAGFHESPSVFVTYINGVKYQLPYEGAEVRDIWELRRPKSEFGAVPEDEFVKINDTLYELIKNETSMYIVINGSIHMIYEVREDLVAFVENKMFVIEDNYNYKVPIGNLTEYGAWETLDYLYLQPYSSYWDDPYTLANGTTLDVFDVKAIHIYMWDINGTIYYSYNEYIEFEYFENETRMYIYLLNGSKLYLEPDLVFEVIGINVTLTTSVDLFTFSGETYNLTELLNAGIPIFHEYYKGVNVSGSLYLVGRKETWTMSFNITWMGNNYTVEGAFEFVMKHFTIFGYPFGLIYEPLFVGIRMNIWSIVLGTPDYGMWGMRAWTINPENGALDLDGDLGTTEDQFYVKRVYIGNYSWSVYQQSMNVFLFWEPNTTTEGNELHLSAWMGIATNTWSYTWSETFYWYYASNMSIVSEETMEYIRSIVFDNTTGEPKPGYWDIAWMTKNMTWEDVLEKAREEGWDWIEDNTHTWTWLWFGFSEDYFTSTVFNDTYRLTRLSLRYEFAGLFIYNDSNGDGVMNIVAEEGWINPEISEATHYYVFDSVENVTFVTPGESFGDYNATGYIRVGGNESITFGVAYEGINGTAIPFNGMSYWWWYGGELVGGDFDDFDSRPTKCSIDLLSFMLHFQGNLTAVNESYEAYIKIDQYVGRWDPNVPGGLRVLANRSLSLNYYVFVETDTYWSITTEGREITNEEIVEASSFTIGTEDTKFAEIVMGNTYLWEGNLSEPQNVSSFTVPLYTFQSIYVGYGSNTSVAGWSFRQDMYFLSIGFAKWSGYGVYQDPEVISHVGGKNTTTTPKVDENPPIIMVAALDHEPNYDESPTIVANVTDDSDVKRVYLYYNYDGTTYQVEMFKDIDGLYKASIPALPYGTQVTYWIYAEDVYGNFAETTHLSYTVRDYDAPEIISINYQAGYNEKEHVVEVNITVEVSEPVNASGIKRVYVTYLIDGESYEEELQEIGNGVYFMTISVPENKETLKYTITAEDNAGNENTSQQYIINITNYVPPSPGAGGGGGAPLGLPELTVIIVVAAASLVTVLYYVRKSKS